MGARTDRTAGRLALGLADSAVSSIGNLGVSVLAAHLCSLTGFGVFATAMLVLLLATMAARSGHGEALVLRIRDGGASPADVQDSTTSVVRLSGALGGGIAVLATVVGFVAGFGEGLTTVLVAAAALPLLCLQDHLRWIEYARGASQHALVNNALWTGTSLGALAAAAAVVPHPVSAPLCLAAWAAGTIPGIAYGLRRTGVSLTPALRPGWLQRNRRLATPLFLDFTLTQATAQGATLVIAALAGPLDMAAIRKGQIWLGAAAVATTGLLAALQPLLAQRAAVQGHAATVRLGTLLGLAGMAGLLLYGLVVALLPGDLARVLVGEGWDEARPFVWPLAVQAAAGLLGGCWGLSLRVTGRLAAQVRWRTVLGPLSLVVVAVVTAGAGAVAGTWALAAVAAGTTAVWGVLLATADREERRRVPVIV
ncbi:hypothetical protein [Blastococcus sp. URHD0036]|uniref:hypothetical protein n=1 Tax=Blastococcus sp. URHD0036 TaxID=1380356 RepID=UPI00049580BB|nr:hypothetical protein [Blastococcus sp. URHD0036]